MGDKTPKKRQRSIDCFYSPSRDMARASLHDESELNTTLAEHSDADSDEGQATSSTQSETQTSTDYSPSPLTFYA